MSPRAVTIAALLLGLSTFTVYAVAPQRVQSDSIWSVPLALTLLQDGALTLDRYAETCARISHGCTARDGHLQLDFPVAASLMAAVPLALVEGVVHAWPWPGRQLERWETHAHARGDIDLGFFDVTENLIASGIVALAVVFFFLAALRRLGSMNGALLAAGVFAFGTSLFSTASRVLWQHGPALLFGAIALWLCQRELKRGGLVLMGACLAAAWVCRPTMALFGLAMCWPLWRAYGRSIVWVGLGGGLVLASFVGLNQATLGAPLPDYFFASRLRPGSALFFEALAGNLVSPGRGLLLFTPVLLLVPLGFSRGARAPVDVAMAAWLVAHWVAISAFPHWWAGHCFGPRLWTEAMLGACWLLVPLFAGRARVWLALAVLSVVIHTRGATSYVPWAWNTAPQNVDEAPARLWDWSDPQFLRFK